MCEQPTATMMPRPRTSAGDGASRTKVTAVAAVLMAAAAVVHSPTALKNSCFFAHAFVVVVPPLYSAGGWSSGKDATAPWTPPRASAERRAADDLLPSTLATRLNMSPDDDDDPSSSRGSEDSDSDSVDSFRSLLESSWNPARMGSVPTSPESAALEAAASVKSALDAAGASAGGSGGKKPVLMVDLRLPAFDISQGPNVYDEVLASEFCARLAEEMRENGAADSSLILLRDDGAAGDVGRVIEAKERRRREDEEYERARAGLESEASSGASKEDDGDQDDDETKTDEEVEDFNDDVAAAGGGGGDGADPAPSSETDAAPKSEAPANQEVPPSDAGNDGDDVDAFRKQLMSNWNDDDSSAAADEAAQKAEKLAAAAQESSSSAAPAAPPRPPPTPSPPPAAPGAPRPYRLSSLFGPATIDPTSPDMFPAAVAAADSNVDDSTTVEGALIILSPRDAAEMVAVRRLIQRYSTTKTILLVNCRLDPLPAELLDATVAYSIRPLIARAAPATQNNPLRRRDPTEKEREESATKIVVMRRHPGEWEVFVDGDGDGFELADTIPDAALPRESKDGPGMEWVAGATKRHMRDKFAGGSS